MSIQWTFIAGYLYFEVAIVIIMILPIFSPRRWNQFFKSRIFSMFQTHAAAYFYVLLGVLSLFLIDAIREMKKYSSPEAGAHVNLAHDMKGSVKLFRSQRNFYITGFAIFLAFVIRRLVSMLIIQDELTQKAEKIAKEAEVAVEEAKKTVFTKAQNKLHCVNEELKGKLDVTEKMLMMQRTIVAALEADCFEWKLKYKEAMETRKDENGHANGHGNGHANGHGGQNGHAGRNGHH